MYVVGELTPHLVGASDHVALGSFGIEKRVGRHVFQANFSNWIRTTTLREVVHGGETFRVWYFGFNITRKFF